MNACRFLLFIVVICSLRADEIPKAQGIEVFDAWVSARVSQEEIPGALVGIVFKDKLIWSKAYGKERVDQKALFPIASLTKSFTALGIMKLWQEGRLELDVPVERYLPGFKVNGYMPNVKPITVRHLLNHTSGLPENPDFPYWNDLQFPEFHEIWKSLPFLTLAYEPGKEWKYSHLGYALLGKVIEAASSEVYQSYLISRFLTPLRLTSTTFFPEPSKVVQGYTKRMMGIDRTPISFYDMKGMKAAFGLYSTLDDLAKFSSLFLMQLSQESILSTPNRRCMMTSSVSITKDVSFGLGFFIRRVQDRSLFEHSGGLPGYSAYLSMDPRSQLGLIVLCTSREPLTSWADSFYNWVVKAPPNDPENSALRVYAGTYSSPEGVVYIFVRQNRLALYAPLVRDQLYYLAKNPSEDAFTVQDIAPLTGLNSDKIFFLRDDSGGIKSLKIGNTYYSPVVKGMY